MVLPFWWSRITSKDKIWALFNFFRTGQKSNKNCQCYLTIYIYTYLYIYIYEQYIHCNKHHHCVQPMHFWCQSLVLLGPFQAKRAATRRCCRAMVCDFAQRSLKKFQIHCDCVVLVPVFFCKLNWKLRKYFNIKNPSSPMLIISVSQRSWAGRCEKEPVKCSKEASSVYTQTREELLFFFQPWPKKLGWLESRSKRIEKTDRRGFTQSEWVLPIRKTSLTSTSSLFLDSFFFSASLTAVQSFFLGGAMFLFSDSS